MHRRNILKAGITLGLGTIAGSCVNGPKWKPTAYRKPAISRVAILKAASYEENLTELIQEGIKLCSLAVTGKRVLLKPNLVEYERDAVINTNPAVIGGAIEAFMRLGAREVRVGEGPGHRRDTDGLLVPLGCCLISKTREPLLWI